MGIDRYWIPSRHDLGHCWLGRGSAWSLWSQGDVLRGCLVGEGGGGHIGHRGERVCFRTTDFLVFLMFSKFRCTLWLFSPEYICTCIFFFLFFCLQISVQVTHLEINKEAVLGYISTQLGIVDSSVSWLLYRKFFSVQYRSLVLGYIQSLVFMRCISNSIVIPSDWMLLGLLLSELSYFKSGVEATEPITIALNYQWGCLD